MNYKNISYTLSHIFVVLFVGLSASNYVVAGSIIAAVLHIYNCNLYLCIIACILTHITILYIMYTRIRNIWIKYQKEDIMGSWWKLCFIPVFFYCGFSCLTFFPYTLDEHPENIPGVMMFLIAMFLSYIILMQYIATASRQTTIYWQNIIYKSHIEGLENQYHMVEQSEKNLRILRHDMRHYSSLIYSLLEQGEYDEIKKVIEHINAVTDENKVTKYCDNIVANTMLRSMMEKACLMDIEVRRDIFISKEIPVDNYEFAMIIANLLDNAFHCVKEFDKQKKQVYAKIQCEKDHLLIHMNNKYEGELLFDSETGLPRSRRGQNHGFGMQSVKAFSDKTGGMLSCYSEDDMFHIRLFSKFS
ncbi:MAG: GHKL domain-containing protein [Roseburia sp.]|nr:GHKL domain-containing protein [Roseburia sp.]